MRVKALTILLFATLLPAIPAFARPGKSARKAAQHAKSYTAPVRTAGTHAAQARTRATSRGTTRTSARGRAARQAPMKQSSRYASRRAGPTRNSRSSQSDLARSRLEAAPEPPAPEPAIHVHHDPKVHHKPAPYELPSSSPSDANPHFAVSDEDFQPIASSVADATPAPVSGIDRKHPVKLTTSSDDPSVGIHHSKIIVKAPVEDLVVPPPFQPVLAYRRGHLVVPPALKGSHEILLRQNEMADREGLDRVQDDDDLDRLREAKLLVAIPTGAGIQVDDRLPYNRRYCRPWTAKFLAALGRAHYARFHSSLQVNSAVRTVEFQQRLLLTNGNAAPAEGETASPHLTGQAVDLAKHGLSMTEVAWLRGYLLPLVQQGKVDVEEEFQQACFHISVYQRYLPQAAPRRVIQSRHASTSTSLAAAIR